jgi:hypothetical protein
VLTPTLLAGKFAGEMQPDFLLSPPFADQPALMAVSRFGFRFGFVGGHGSRTLMLAELGLLMGATIGGALKGEDWKRLAVEDNVMAKPTLHTRSATLQRLREMYGLDDELPLFRVFRFFWEGDPQGRPLHAMFLALARDPLFRFSAPVILKTPPGDPVPRELFITAFQSATGSHYKPSMVDKLVRHVGSSWTQTGHLRGRTHKVRQRVSATPAALAHALCIPYLLGLRGNALLGTVFARLLDLDPRGLMVLAREARRVGYLDMKESGDVLEISFPRILTSAEKSPTRA